MSRHDDLLARCDRCGAESKWQITLGDAELRFCNHHYSEHRVVLEKYEVIALVPERVSV